MKAVTNKAAELTQSQKTEAINYVRTSIGKKMKTDQVFCLKHGTPVADAICIIADRRTKRGHIGIDAEMLCCSSFHLITETFLKKI